MLYNNHLSYGMITTVDMRLAYTKELVNGTDVYSYIERSEEDPRDLT